MSNRNSGLSIDASYQFSVHLAKWFQRGQTWPPQAILVLEWLISKNFFPETAWPK
jgi:hypothetical protein